MKRLVVLLATTACSGNAPSSGEIDAPPTDTTLNIDSPASAFTASSTELASGSFPAANTCTGPGNTSPSITWMGDTAGALSFAVTLTDPDAANLIHWTIYDIPGGATGLPAGVEKAYAPGNVSGAHQTTSYQAATRGYLGPCPPVLHTYRFDVYGLDVATLPGTSMTTQRADVVQLAGQHMVAHASFTASYAQP